MPEVKRRNTKRRGTLSYGKKRLSLKKARGVLTGCSSKKKKKEETVSQTQAHNMTDFVQSSTFRNPLQSLIIPPPGQLETPLTIPSQGNERPPKSTLNIPPPGKEKPLTSNLNIPPPGNETTSTSNLNIPPPGNETTLTSNLNIPPPGNETTSTSNLNIPPPGNETTSTSNLNIPLQGQDDMRSMSADISQDVNVDEQLGGIFEVQAVIDRFNERHIEDPKWKGFFNVNFKQVVGGTFIDQIVLPFTQLPDGTISLEMTRERLLLMYPENIVEEMMPLMPMIATENPKNNLAADLEKAHKHVWTKGVSEKLPLLFDKLQEHNRAHGFKELIDAIANGIMPTDEISLLTVLDRAHYLSLKTTTQMRYNDTIKNLWRVLKLESGGRSLRVLGGPNHKGWLVHGKTTKGRFKPSEGLSNFVIPSTKTLNKHSIADHPFAGNIQPGLIQEAIENLPKNKDLVLLADAKGVARGLLPEGQGDVDLWGKESNPNKAEMIAYLQELLDAFRGLERETKIENLLLALQTFSGLIQRMIARIRYWQARMRRMEKQYERQKNYRSFLVGTTWAKASIHSLNLSMDEVRKINKGIGALICHLRGCEDLYHAPSDASRELLHMSNCSFLLSPSVVGKQFKLVTYLTKPGTAPWKEHLNKAYLTTENFFQGIGLATMGAFKKVLNGKDKLEVAEDDITLQARVAEASATIAAKIVPVFFKDAKLKETGVYYLKIGDPNDDDEVPLLASAPKFLMQLQENETVPVVLKLTENSVDDPLNIQDVCRALLEMAVLQNRDMNVRRCLHISYNTHHTVAFEIPADLELEDKMIKLARERYVDDWETSSTLLLSQLYWKDEFTELLGNVQNKATLLINTSSIVMTLGKPSRQSDTPYTPSEPLKRNRQKEARISELKANITRDCKRVLTESHELLREPAEEIFAIMATDTNRDGGAVKDIPVAYALTRKGVSNEQLRYMMNTVMNELKDRGLRVVCQVFDGAHHGYISQAEITPETEGKFRHNIPLTKTKLAVDTWNQFKDQSKRLLVGKIGEMTSVTEKDKADLSQEKRADVEGKTKRFGNVIVEHKNSLPLPKSFHAEPRSTAQRQQDARNPLPFDEMSRDSEQRNKLRQIWKNQRGYLLTHGKFFLASAGGPIALSLKERDSYLPHEDVGPMTQMVTFVGEHFRSKGEGHVPEGAIGPWTKQQWDNRYSETHLTGTFGMNPVTGNRKKDKKHIVYSASGQKEITCCKFQPGETTVDQFFEEDPDATFEYDPELQLTERQYSIYDLLVKRYPEFLSGLLPALKSENTTKRENFFADMDISGLLLILMDPHQHNAALIKRRIDLILKYAESKLGVRFPSYGRKAEGLEMLSQFFGGFVTGSIQTLAALCKNILTSASYPTYLLRVAVANAYHHVKTFHWKEYASNRCKVCQEPEPAPKKLIVEAKDDRRPVHHCLNSPLSMVIDQNGNQLQAFYITEFVENRQQNEHRLCDAYHILTNLRKGATRGDYSKELGGHSDAWNAVLKTNKDLITPAIVYDNVDKQSGDLAKRVFSEKVQEVLMGEWSMYQDCQAELCVQLHGDQVCDQVENDILDMFVEEAVTSFLTNADELASTEGLKVHSEDSDHQMNKQTDHQTFLTEEWLSEGSYRQPSVFQVVNFEDDAVEEVVGETNDDQRSLATTEVENQDDERRKEKMRREFQRRIATKELLIMHTNDAARDKAMKCRQTAEMVYYFRTFYEACDQRGLSADERTQRLVAVFKYLTEGVDFDHFTGRTMTHFKGIPIVTYEAMLSNVWVRLQMYSVCKDEAYCARALSTLALECFFSTLAREAVNTCPKAVDIPRIFEKLVETNAARRMSKEELGFHNYPGVRFVYPLIKDDEMKARAVPQNSDSHFKNHSFDVPGPGNKNSRHEKLGWFTTGMKPLHGVQPVRSNYKTDESRINQLHRQGYMQSEIDDYAGRLGAGWEEQYAAVDDMEIESDLDMGM